MNSIISKHKVEAYPRIPTACEPQEKLIKELEKKLEEEKKKVEDITIQKMILKNRQREKEEGYLSQILEMRTEIVSLQSKLVMAAKQGESKDFNTTSIGLRDPLTVLISPNLGTKQ